MISQAFPQSIVSGVSYLIDRLSNRSLRASLTLRYIHCDLGVLS
jgi:hypothetical protein